LPKTLGRALAVAGSGSGLTSRALAATVGAETQTLAAGNIPSLTSVNASQAITVTSGSTNVTQGPFLVAGSTGAGGPQVGNTQAPLTSTGNNSISVTYTNASPTAVSIMQPSTFFNVMVKQ